MEDRVPMLEHVYIADRRAADDAAQLLADYGTAAPAEASARADRSRNLGNVIHFCRWRQIERLVAVLGSEDAVGTVH